MSIVNEKEAPGSEWVTVDLGIRRTGRRSHTGEENPALDDTCQLTKVIVQSGGTGASVECRFRGARISPESASVSVHTQFGFS
jgi:hypothetical protein